MRQKFRLHFIVIFVICILLIVQGVSAVALPTFSGIPVNINSGAESPEGFVLPAFSPGLTGGTWFGKPVGAADREGQGTSANKIGHDPFTVIDEKLSPSEAEGLKSLIQNTLHAFSYDAAIGDWYARNAASQITFTYTRDGTAKFSEGENSFGLTLLGIGRGDGISPAGKGVAMADGRQLNIARPDYTEWYKNNDEGVEQGLTIASRPIGSGLLHVRFGLTGNNSLSLRDKKTLILTDAPGTPLFEYTGLHAFSSEGRDLPASLATDGTTLSWVVDDTGAVYPITIDPVVVSASAAKATFKGKDDKFGYSVALNSSGAVALVGAIQNKTGGDPNAGAAYIFTMPAGGWSGTTSASAATATFTGGAANDFFGCSVALNSTGAVALVGAYNNNTAGSQAGAAYIFTMPAGGWSGTTSASKANATFTGGRGNDQFGYSVALNSTGAVALVGARYNNTVSSQDGAAYIFTMPPGGWSGTTTSASSANATFTGGANNEFGTSVALNSTGTLALIGAIRTGAAYIFEAPGGVWNGTTSASAANATFTQGAISDDFGCSVALSSDGKQALIGATYNDTAGDNAGAAYIFTMPAGGWSGTTSASKANATFTGGYDGDHFGNSVALNSTGAVALVGAWHNKTAGSSEGAVHGAAYLFTMPTGGWSGTTSASKANTTFTGAASGDTLGWSVALNSTGAVALVGASYDSLGGADAAYIFQPPYVTLTAGGTTTGAAGTVVNGLTLNPTGTLPNVDLYLGTDAATRYGSAINTTLSLPASTATTVDRVDLTGRAAGTYYLIVCDNGTANILGATTSASYTVYVPVTPVASFSSRNITVAINTTSQGWAGAAPFSMMFNDTSTGPATSRVWNATNVTGNNVPFYLNSTAVTLANITYSFSRAGNYTIQLNATNSVGTNISTQVLWVNVSVGTPTFTSITPSTGTTAGGRTVIIAGTNLNGATSVTFGGTAAASYTVNSDTQITAVTPAKTAGAVNVVITTPEGTATGAGAYTYTTTTPTPSPAPSPVNGGSDGPPAPVVPGAPAVTGKSSISEVNVGGNSAVTHVAITGTGISDAIVTGTVVSGPGPNADPPSRLVYEYIELTPARYATINEALISFRVPVAWLTEHQLTPPNVIMYHLVGQTWVALPTTLVSVQNGVAHYTTVSNGFSRYAIAGEAGFFSLTPLPTLTPAGQTFGDQVSAPTGTVSPPPAAVTAQPITTQTTAIPEVAQPAPVLPLPAIAIAGVIIVVLVAGGFLIRRWWIRRQNPALFRKYD